ncbi:integrating conjugative element protein [Psychromonas sp. B3M02]|uniref:integrating conjugative element protein n=1 Tax=Psychromonas sp. B3M02 TaxID=2267226 RepID=UPI000DE87BD4|nr:integrating conjugative element protein [Psychromonas sp. B3M02]RBW47313.1 integrating conjugative element protein [Psychromonas sp. B3M02]
MKKVIFKSMVLPVVLVFNLGSIPNTVLASDTTPVADSLFYYKLGGGRAFRALPRWQVTSILLSYKTSTTGLTCGGFDPNITISNTLNSVKSGLEDSYTQMESAATAAIANLPGYVLSKVNPNLYDLFMNAIASAEVDFDLATKSCEMIQAEIQDGQDPFEDLASISVGDTWKSSVGTSGVDILNVQEAAEDSKVNGIVHPCYGRAGGENQTPYNIITDVASIGYNRLLDRNECETSVVASTTSSEELITKFESPAAVKEWVKLVVGDVTYDEDSSSSSSSTPGAGLLPLVNSRKTEVYNGLIDMYNGSTEATLDNLSEISAPGLMVTAQIITGLRTLGDRKASIFINRLSDEIAISDTINSALLIRRTLATGKKESDVYSSKAITEKVSESITELDEEIDLVLKENEVKKSLMGESIPLLLNLVRQQEQAANGTAPVQNEQGNQLEDGRIKR